MFRLNKFTKTNSSYFSYLNKCLGIKIQWKLSTGWFVEEVIYTNVITIEYETVLMSHIHIGDKEEEAVLRVLPETRSKLEQDRRL